jgi:hypothetical protein
MKPVEHLIELLKQDKVIPVIGAGVSFATAGIPGWKGLLEHGIEYAQERNIDKKGLIPKIRTEIDENNLPKAANHLKELLNAPSFPFVNWLNDNFSNVNIKSKDLINSVLDLDCTIISTTNYDDLLTKIADYRKRTEFVYSDYQQVINAIKTQMEITIHLHGIYSKPDSIILSEDDYSSLNANLGYKELLKKMLSDYHLLFIGCSKDGVMDEDFLPLFNFIKEWMPHSTNQHFILLHDNEIKKQSHIDLLTTCNVEAISFGDDYSLLGPYINSINPNLERRQSKIEQFGIQFKEDFNRILALKRTQKAKKVAFEKLISKNLDNKYDWIDSGKMKIFEKLFTDHNKTIKNKKDQLIFIQSIIQSIVNVSELQSKIDLWNKHSQRPENLSSIHYINTALIAYECLLKIPKEIINDLQYFDFSGMHRYFFSGYLDSFAIKAREIVKDEKKLEIYKEDKYLFENLKRIIDTLLGFLKLNPNKVYQKIQKASISNLIPNSFLVVSTTSEISLRNALDLKKVYARLPKEKNLSIFKIEVVEKEGEIYIIAANSKYVFYWQPNLNITSIILYNTTNSDTINDFMCIKIGSDSKIIIRSSYKLITFNNFEKLSEVRNTVKFHQLEPFRNHLIATKRVDSLYQGDFLFKISTEGTFNPLLSISELTHLLENHTSTAQLIKEFKNDDIFGHFNIIDDVKLQIVNLSNKELLLLKARFILTKMTSLLILCDLKDDKIDVLNIIHLDKTVASSYDHLSKDNTLKIVAGYYDMNRKNSLGELIVIDKKQKTSIKELTRKRTNKDVNDILEVCLINEHHAIFNEESTSLISFTLSNGKSKNLKFSKNERIEKIKYYKNN